MVLSFVIVAGCAGSSVTMVHPGSGERLVCPRRVGVERFQVNMNQMTNTWRGGENLNTPISDLRRRQKTVSRPLRFLATFRHPNQIRTSPIETSDGTRNGT